MLFSLHLVIGNLFFILFEMISLVLLYILLNGIIGIMSLIGCDFDGDTLPITNCMVRKTKIHKGFVMKFREVRNCS